jgi:DnaJ-class molecular chaperone
MNSNKEVMALALTKSRKTTSRKPIIVNDIVTKGVHPQALMELQAILKKPYKDVCVVCDGSGKNPKGSACPKCKGTGDRLLRLL